MNKSVYSYKDGLRDGLPIALGYLSVSFTFGMMATEKGLPFLASVLISMTNLTSAGQFAGLSLIVAGGTYIEMLLTEFVINIRYSLMSISVSQKFDKGVTFFDRLLIAFGMTDEIFAVAVCKEKDVGKSYMFGLITGPYLGWTIGTIIGAISSSILPASVLSALGIAIYGMFIAIIVPPSRKSRPVLWVVVIAAAISCIFFYTPVLKTLSSGFVIIISGVVAAGIGAVVAPIREEEGAQ